MPLRTDRQNGQVVDPTDINQQASEINRAHTRLDLFDLDDLVDVSIPSAPAGGYVLTYDASQQVWRALALPPASTGAVSSVAGRTGAVALVKGDVGLDAVDNTSDASKPISNLTAGALAAKADLVNGKVPASQIPAVAITEYLGTASSNAAMLALTGQRGDFVTRTDSTVMGDGQPALGDWILTADAPSVLANWHRLTSPSSTSGGVTSVNGKTGPAVSLVATDVLTGAVVWQPNTDSARRSVPSGYKLLIIGGSTKPTWALTDDVWLQTA